MAYSTFPYTFPITFPTGYFIEIDWDNDDNFTGTYDDVTAAVTSIHYSRGKSDERGKAQTGQCTLTLNNSNKLYTPTYSSGALYGNLLPKRPLKVYYSSGGTDYSLFYGFLEEIIPHPHKSEQYCVITAVDGLDFLSRHDLNTALYTDTATGTIHGYILDDAGWSSTMRTIDTGQTTVPYWYGGGVKARTEQLELDDNEQGFSYVGGNGYFNFEDRHHRSTATHQTSQSTFDNTMSNMSYSMNPKNIYNEIKVTVTPWELQSIAELWRLEETPAIPAGETLTWWGDASVSGESVFVAAWTTPAATTDYTANSESGGGGTDMTSDITLTATKFARTIKLQLENTALIPAYITLLKARGTYYDDKTRVVRKAADSTSQDTYQKRTLEINGKYMSDASEAQDLCDYAKGKYKDPRGEISINLMNQDATILAKLLALDISDRITIDNDDLDISADYFIDSLEVDISQSQKLHTVHYELVDCTNEDFWCLGYSALGTQTKLGY